MKSVSPRTIYTLWPIWVMRYASDAAWERRGMRVMRHASDAVCEWRGMRVMRYARPTNNNIERSVNDMKMGEMKATGHLRVSTSRVLPYFLYLQCVLNAIWHSRWPQHVWQLSAPSQSVQLKAIFTQARKLICPRELRSSGLLRNY